MSSLPEVQYEVSTDSNRFGSPAICCCCSTEFYDPTVQTTWEIPSIPEIRAESSERAFQINFFALFSWKDYKFNFYRSIENTFKSFTKWLSG